MNDLIVEEVRQARAEIAAEFGYDLTRYHIWLQQQQSLREQTRKMENGGHLSPDAGMSRHLRTTEGDLAKLPPTKATPLQT